MTQAITPVLLCGGSGTRLWPLSRKDFPKQFSAFGGAESLFQASARRLSGPDFAKPIVVTLADFRFIVTEQMSALGQKPAAILIEPEGRNTAPAILVAALSIDAAAPGSLMLVAPSDHVIPDAAAFHKAVRAAIPTAAAGQIVTFGVRPDRAETGYGWLELTNPVGDFGPETQPLKRFVEKPDADFARAMLQDGRHLWNAGIFLFSTTTILRAFREFCPEMLEPALACLAGARQDLGFTRLDPDHWREIRDISIDYAVMEKSRNLSVMPFAGQWSDLGGWEAVWRASDPNGQGVVTTNGAVAIDCENTLLRSESEGVALVGIGLKNLVAVAMNDAVLIAERGRTEDVKLAVAALRKGGKAQAESFARDHRPWGWFETLALGPRFQVKRITVHPGASLSLQSHHHRAEHWVVVEGTAKVTIDDQVRVVSENQSVFIPLGHKHRLENPGKLPMVLIEVQTGGYLGEDDIIRYDDAYARGQGTKG